MGSFVHLFLPEGTFLYLQSPVFSIGLGHPSSFNGPLLELTAHNFGFGLVITRAVVLGTQGRSWALPVVALAGAWTLLFLVQAWILVGAAGAYLATAQQEEAPIVSRLFFQALHPAMIILPLAIVVLPSPKETPQSPT